MPDPAVTESYLRQRVIPEKLAILVGIKNLPHLKTRELTRRWDKVSDAHMEPAVRLLDVYTSAKNADPSQIVVDPIASLERYPGMWVASRNAMDKQGEIGGVLQVLSEVWNLANDDDLDGWILEGKFRKTRENEILQLFDLQDGEGDSIVYVFSNIAPTLANETYCMDTVSDATLVTKLADATYSYAKRRFDRRDDRNTATFMVAFRKVAWNAWGHDSYAADITDYRHAGSANLEEIIVKTWWWIQNADLATAVSNCRSGTNVTPTSGYIITDVEVSDNHNGSFTITQIQRKQINTAESGSEVLSHHSLHPGTCTDITAVYQNFTADTLPGGDAIGGHVISNVPKIQPDGLWSRRVITRTPTWTNTWAGKIQMSQESAGGHGLTEHNEATGVPDSGYAVALAAAKVSSSASTRTVLMARLIERADGERVIHQSEGYCSTSTDESEAEVHDLKAAVGGQEKAVGRVWWCRTSAAKTTLIGSGGAAVSPFTYSTVTYTQSHTSTRNRGDGRWDVFQVGIVPGGRIWTVRGEEETEVCIRVYEAILRNLAGTPTRYLVGEWRQVFATAALAAAYADNSSVYVDKVGEENIPRTMGRVDYLGNSKWAGFNVTIREAPAGALLVKGSAWSLTDMPNT